MSTKLATRWHFFRIWWNIKDIVVKKGVSAEEEQSDVHCLSHQIDSSLLDLFWFLTPVPVNS